MSTEVANIEERKLSTQLEQREIKAAQWHTLARSLYPGASQESILMVIDYCRARGLDPLKKPCHIVPMDVKVGRSYEKRDVVMPGIYEYRTTAQKTHQYMGHSVPEYGEEKEFDGVWAPEWCSMTVYRWNEQAQTKAEYPVKVWFKEIYATKYDKDSGKHVINARWSRAPRQMLTKCTEAAALREAFPDELGGEMTFEEMVDQHPIELDSQAPPFTMSKQAVTKVVKAMNDAIDKGEHSAVWEIYMESSEEEWNYVTGKLDRWRAKEWREAIEAAAREVQAEGGVIPDGVLSEKDQRREDVRNG